MRLIAAFLFLSAFVMLAGIVAAGDNDEFTVQETLLNPDFPWKCYKAELNEDTILLKMETPYNVTWDGINFSARSLIRGQEISVDNCSTFLTVSEYLNCSKITDTRHLDVALGYPKGGVREIIIGYTGKDGQWIQTQALYISRASKDNLAPGSGSKVSFLRDNGGHWGIIRG